MVLICSSKEEFIDSLFCLSNKARAVCSFNEYGTFIGSIACTLTSKSPVPVLGESLSR